MFARRGQKEVCYAQDEDKKIRFEAAFPYRNGQGKVQEDEPPPHSHEALGKAKDALAPKGNSRGSGRSKSKEADASVWIRSELCPEQ